jgi:hypothetical protein
VLEDLELLSKGRLLSRDPEAVGYCVKLVEQLQNVVGEAAMRESTRRLSSRLTAAYSFRQSTQPVVCETMSSHNCDRWVFI